MASKEQIQKALDELWTKYGNTLSMLSDALDKIDAQQSKINKLESDLDVEPDIELNLSTPAAIEQLEKTVLNRHEEK